MVSSGETVERTPKTDGALIVYSKRPATGSGVFDQQDICWQPVAGGTEQCLELAGYQTWPSVSDGLIAFGSYTSGDGASDLYVYHVETNRLFRITSTQGLREDLVSLTSLPDSRFRLTWSEGEIEHRDVRGLTFTLPELETFTFGGLQQPVDPFPTFNSMKAGAAVAAKFSLGGFKGMDIFAAGYPTSGTTACAGTNMEDPIEQTVTAGSSGLQYDAATDTYSYIWKTEKGWAGTCRQLKFQFGDGSVAYANFTFK